MESKVTGLSCSLYSTSSGLARAPGIIGVVGTMALEPLRVISLPSPSPVPPPPLRLFQVGDFMPSGYDTLEDANIDLRREHDLKSHQCDYYDLCTVPCTKYLLSSWEELSTETEAYMFSIVEQVLAKNKGIDIALLAAGGPPL